MAEDENYTDKIPKLRETFAELFAGSLNSNVYDERDIDRLRLDDEHVRGFLRHQKGNIEKAATMIDTCLKWRKEMELNDLDHKSFPREMHELGAVYWHNEDNKGQKILYFCVKKNKKDPEKLLLVKKFVAWHIDKHYKRHPDKKIVALLDMTDAGFANMDMDLIKFQISCFTTYFPGLLAYMLIYEMPWVLNAIWKVIKTLLSAEQQRAVIFVKRSEVQKYIEPAQLWKHMGGQDDYEYTYIPSEDSGIELFNGDMGTPTEEDDLLSLSVESTNSSASAARKRVTFSENDPVVYTSFDGDSLDEADGRCQTNNNNKSSSLNIAQRRASEEDNVFVSPILTISPAEELEFCTADESRDSLDIISLTNTTEKHVAYKVKTTSPEKYRVRPSTGVIQPNGHADIYVYLHAGQTSGVAKDKFLIMFMEVEPEVTVSQVNELFKVTSRDKYSEHRLRCKLGVSKVVPEGASPASGKSSMSDQINKLTQQMDSLLSSQQRLESQLSHIKLFVTVLLGVILLLILTVCLTYWMEYLPVNKYTVNACVPHYL